MLKYDPDSIKETCEFCEENLATTIVEGDPCCDECYKNE